MSDTVPYILNVATPADTPVITAEDMQTVLRVSDPVELEYIETLIAAATELVEGNTGKVMIATQFEMQLCGFPICEIEIPRTPLMSIDSIKYDDQSGVEQTLVANTDYSVVLGSDRRKGYVTPAYGRSWPGTRRHNEAVRVVFTAGFGTTDDAVPRVFLQQVRLLVKHWFVNRSAVSCGSMMRSELAYDYLQFFNERKEFA